MPAAGRAIRGAQWADVLRREMAHSSTDTVAWMEQHTRALKSDRYSRVGTLELQGQPCWLKLYIGKSYWQRLGFRLGYGRAVHSFDAAHKLSDKGLAVPAPRTCTLVPEGIVLLTEGIVPSSDLRTLWLAQLDRARVMQLMSCAGESIAALHAAGFAHGDCKWGNLLWDGQRFLLVDLEAVRSVKMSNSDAFPLPAGQQRDLARYTVDAEELAVNPEQYSVFMASYCARRNFSIETVSSAIKPAVEYIRRRHRARYGGEHRALV